MRSSAGRSKAGSGGRPAAQGRERRTGAFGRRPKALELIESFGRGEFPATLYLEGPSEPLKAAVLAELRNGWRSRCPEAPLARVLMAGESKVEEILAAFQNISLFSPRELIVVHGIEDLGRSEKKITALAEAIARPAGASCLVLVESASDSLRKSLDPLRASCQVVLDALPPSRSDLLRWGALRLSRDKLEAGPGALEAIVDGCEGDALAFFGELDKLGAWAAATGRIERDDVARLLRPVVGADLPEYLSAVALGDSPLAAQRLGRLLAAGVGEGAVLFALSNLVGGSLGGWARYRDLSVALERRASREGLGRALDAIYRAEAAWKGGRADVVAVLEQATREVCAAR